ncbi:MAG: galactokinase [Bacteroidales bacterium]|nr:galactokinase [Bacteroidales bacterium]
MSHAELVREFLAINGGTKEDVRAYFAPGRVNLIGEHTDYNGGYVLPFALQYGTTLLVRKISDPMLKFKSMNFNIIAEVCLKKAVSPVGNTWINYPLGVIKEFNTINKITEGLEILYYGDIPNEAGLSSSASIEMVTAFAVNDLFNYGLPMTGLIKMSQKAENEFVGMNCGIMDQFAVGMGIKDHAVFLNCDTLDYEQVPFVLHDYLIVISNTNKKRSLAGSKYNERRQQCEDAVNDINKEHKIKNLSELSLTEFGVYKSLIKNEVSRKRALHVVSENQRVLDAVESLRKGDLKTFGTKMIESHISLRDDYEVSCHELDILVEEALKIEGVLGSRMTGAGFGGCAISLVHKDQIETFKKKVGKTYFEKTGLKADFYFAEPTNGIGKIV